MAAKRAAALTTVYGWRRRSVGGIRGGMSVVISDGGVVTYPDWANEYMVDGGELDGLASVVDEQWWSSVAALMLASVVTDQISEHNIRSATEHHRLSLPSCRAPLVYHCARCGMP